MSNFELVTALLFVQYVENLNKGEEQEVGEDGELTEEEVSALAVDNLYDLLAYRYGSSLEKRENLMNLCNVFISVLPLKFSDTKM